MPAAVECVRPVRGGGVAAVPGPVPELSELAVGLKRAVRWAEAERDAAAGRMLAYQHEAAADPSPAWRWYCRRMAAWDAAQAREFDDLARTLADRLGRRVAEETRGWAERQALAWLDRAA